MPRARFVIAAGLSLALYGVYALGGRSRPAAVTSLPAADSRDAAADAPIELRFAPTSALIGDPGLARQVDELARHARIEDRAIGIDGERSKVWELFREIVATAPREQLLALLRHESVVVRGYVATYALETLPEATDRVYPLFADATSVASLAGCIGTQQSLANHLARVLVNLPSRADRVVLAERIAGDTRLVAEARGSALAYVAGADSTRGRALALALRSDPNPLLRRAGLEALGRAGLPADVELVAPSLASPDAAERTSALVALEGLGSPRAGELIERLLDDPDDSVRERAYRAYGASVHARPARLRELLASKGAASAARGVASRGTEDALALLEPLLMNDVTVSTEEVEHLLAKVGPSSLPRVRRLLGSADERVRWPAIATLGRLDDRASVDEIQAFLDKGKIAELAPAAKIVADWNVVDAIPQLAGRLRDENDHVRIAAANALVRLHAREAIPALAASAAERRGTWSEKDLRAALAELRAL